jgi:methionine salvage enolase-phosphatase E1
MDIQIYVYTCASVHGFEDVLLMTWDRCYDFLNIFAEKFGEKIGVFDSKQSYVKYAKI